MSQKLANLRAALYTVAGLIGAVAVAHGIIKQEQLALYLPIIPALFALAVAIINVRSNTTIEMELHPDVTDALSRIEEKLDTPPAEPETPAPDMGDHYDPTAETDLIAGYNPRHAGTSEG
jgi:hypothetical protein|nr:MAG TPA: protein of unknown function DUF2368 [Caudoviricetes sp.]